MPLPASAADPAPATGPFTVTGSVASVGLEAVASGLGPVTGITHAGDLRLFITLQDGRIVILDGGAVRAEPFLDLRSLVSTGGERGLLSAAFPARHDETGYFFVDYTDRNGDTVIARYRASADRNRADPASARVLLTIPQPFANHNGGQLQFGDDGHLYVGMGDGGAAFDPDCRAQKGNTLLGKLLRLDVEQNVDVAPFYGIPADNPFRGPGDPLDEIWVSGLRNPWRFSFDNDELWIADVGQGQREEVDFQSVSSSGGENYGWKVLEGTRCSSSDACPAGTPGCTSSAYTAPVLEYAHGPHCSITGGYVYRGRELTQLYGGYVFGDLCSGALWAAFRDGSSLVVRSLPVTADGLTTFGEDRDQELYAGTLGGVVYRFVRTGSASAAHRVGLFEPQPSRFDLKAANSRAGAVSVIRFGPRNSRRLPLAGDWDGDGTTTVGLYDATTATFYLKNGASGRDADIVLQLVPPQPGALPVAGDWDGDGSDGVGFLDLREPLSPRFWLWNTLVSGAPFDESLGLVVFSAAQSGALPVAGDWDGDGRDEIGIYDPAASFFVLGGRGELFDVQLGTPGRHGLPLAGDWDGDGRDTVGVYDPAAAVFRLRNSPSTGPPDLTFRFGPPRGGWLPIAGDW